MGAITGENLWFYSPNTNGQARFEQLVGNISERSQTGVPLSEEEIRGFRDQISDMHFFHQITSAGADRLASAFDGLSVPDIQDYLFEIKNS